MAARIKVAVALIFIVAFLMIPALAFLQQQEGLTESMPAGEGGELVKTVCVTCHTLGTVLTRSRSEQDWRATVTEMIARGAQISTQEADTVINYLSEHYPVDASLATGSLDPPGKSIVTSKCFQCHGDAFWKHVRMSQMEWKGVLYRMVARGALWTEDEINQMAAYFSRAYGPEIP